jgi:hypothetical protein
LPCSARHRALGKREVFGGTGKVVPHIQHRQSVVRNANQEAYRQMNALDRAATFITNRVSMFGFFLLIFVWTTFWLRWNMLALTQALLAIAREAGLDMAAFIQAFDSGVARAAVLEECRVGREQFGVRDTPTLMLEDGSILRSPIAFPVMHAHRIVRVQKLPCCGEGCIAATRELFERALHQKQG